jgi:hypothetical protein
MTLRAWLVREEGDHFAVGRNVREPVAGVADQELFLRAPVWVHAPNLHVAGAVRLEVDPLTIWGELGHVALWRKESFGATRDRNCISVEVVAMLAGKGNGLAVGRPTVKVGGAVRGDTSGGSTGCGG